MKNILILTALSLGVTGHGGGLSITNPPAPFEMKEAVKVRPKLVVREVLLRKVKEPAKQYSFDSGDNSLKLDPRDPATKELTAGGSAIPVQIEYYGTTAAGHGYPFVGKKPQLTADMTAETLTVTKKFDTTKSDKADGLFIETLKLDKDGLIDVSVKCQVPAGKKLKDRIVMFKFAPFDIVAGVNLLIDGKPYKFSDENAPFGDRKVFDGKCRTIVFNPDIPAKRYELVLDKKYPVSINESRKQEDKEVRRKFNAEMRIRPDSDGSINYKLDITNTSRASTQKGNTYAGINFWKNDRLNIPDYDRSRNLLQNPIFNSGLRYYRQFMIWGTWPGEDRAAYQLSDEQKKFGHHSLKITTWPDYDKPNDFAAFVVPTIPGKKYTFSLYAKADAPDQWFSLRAVTSQWKRFPKMKGFSVPQEWKRFSTTFVAPNNAATIMFKVGSKAKKTAHVWVDGLQFEQAGKASEFTCDEFGSDLVTSAPNNFLTMQQKPDAKLALLGKPGTKGTASIKLIDYFYRTLWSGKMPIKLDASGKGEISLPINDVVGKGVFVISADYKFDNGKTLKDFYRFARMNPLDHEYKNRDLFAVNMSPRTCDSEAKAQRLRHLGFGSVNYARSKLESDLCNKYGLQNTASGTLGYGPKLQGKHSGLDKELYSRLKKESYSKKTEKDIELVAYEQAKANPWVTCWFMQGECNGGGGAKFKVIRDKNLEGFAKYIMATVRGVKKANPNVKIQLTGGPTNMSPKRGTRDIDNWLAACKKVNPNVKFDSIAIHPYRAMPEDPDLDSDAKVFLDMLEKNGNGKTQVYWNEGIYHTLWNVPQWRLSPYKACATDHWRCGTPSYDMGWAERISTAFYARSWLVGLKYADRVSNYNCWGSKALWMDTKLTPYAMGKVPNTLGELLGNATFKEDIRFAPQSRVYVFEDEKKRPVAAFWSYYPMVDRGSEISPVADIDFGGSLPEFIDLMGNTVEVKADAKGKVSIPVTPFPMFARGKTGETQAMVKAFQNAIMQGTKVFPINIDVKLTGRSSASVQLTNRLSRDFAGTIAMSGAAAMPKQQINVKQNSELTLPVKLKTSLPDNEIGKVAFDTTITQKGGDTVNKDFVIYASAVKKLRGRISGTGNLNEWKNIPSIKLSNYKVARVKGQANTLKSGHEGDLEAEYKMAWDDNNLYLLVSVTDDKVYFTKGKGNPEEDWRFDSLQLYFDTFGDNAGRVAKQVFDYNDYCYTVGMVQGSGKLRVFRSATPEQQIAGGLDAPQPNMLEPRIKAKYIPLSKGYACELVFPKTMVAPLMLQNDYFFRFGLLVNDNDGKGRKLGLSNTYSPGAEPYSHPEQWQGILLVK